MPPQKSNKGTEDKKHGYQTEVDESLWYFLLQMFDSLTNQAPPRCVSKTMARSVLLCFRPFSLAGRSFWPLSTQDACAFYSFLSEDLRQLERSLAEGSISLRWSVDAMNFLKKMQIELLALFKKCKLLITFGAEEDWFNQYMQETATLLGFCNSLKSGISGINRYRMLVDLTIQKVVEGNPTCTVSLEELDFGRAGSEERGFLKTRMVTETTVSVGREIGFHCNSKTDKSIAAVMLAAKCAMIVVSVLLVSAIASPLSIEMGSEEIIAEFPQLKPFLEMLASLVLHFHERALKPRKGSRLVLAEHEMVDSTIGELKAQVVGGAEKEKLLVSAELLRTSSDQLREGIEVFDAVVDEVFEVVIKGRNEMLGVFRDGALSVG